MKKFICYIILSWCLSSYGQYEWSNISIGMDSPCRCMKSDTLKDELIMGGYYDLINGVAVDNVVRLKNDTLLPMGNGVYQLGVEDLEFYNDTLYAAGSSGLTQPSFKNLAKYDSSNDIWKKVNGWKAVGPILFDMALYKENLVFIGTYVWDASVNYQIHMYNGHSFVKLIDRYKGTPFGGIQIDSSFILFGELDSIEKTEISNIARWNGTEWQRYGSNDIPTSRVMDVIEFNDTVYAATIEGNVYQLIDTSWVHWKTSNNQIIDLYVVNNSLYIAGAYTQIDGNSFQYVCTYVNGKISPMEGLINGYVQAIEYLNEEIHVCGEFKVSGNPKAKNLAKWTLKSGFVDREVEDEIVLKNPFSQYIQIKSSEIIKQVSVFNISGNRIVTRDTFSSDVLVDASTLDSGLYILEIVTLENSIVRRKAMKW